MEFGWTAEQRRRYEDVLAATTDAFPPEDVHTFTRDKWLRLGKLGVLGASLPRRYGGGELSAVDTARVFEAAGKGCADTGLVFAAAAHLFACAMPILDFGSDATRERLLPGLASGELVAANAMTEADAGSDVGTLSTTATETKGGFVLNGTKTFVSNGPVADVYVTYAVTDPDAGNWGISTFVVDANTPGAKAGPPFHKLGLDGCPAGTVTFDDCFVPADAMLGERGQGSAIFQHSMGWERSCLFALYLGVQDRMIEQCVQHARERRQFGHRLGDFQSVANRIVDMKLRLESARLLLYRACWALDNDEAPALHSALSKLAASEGALASATDAVRLFGGRGYLRSEGIEAALRDAMGSTIFSGTTDIQRRIVAMELGLS
ncbi:acyl-CoA dehydrogenase family protein [Actinocrispum wychmicini]|uniref:Alkylation response protein AidB-like acyl-CoA dehydrogenase n=1 Tax=Actinocrispum wychmicini TaxID=1213861 RepID=A0A4R2JM03_9PSEU|nr:acyl-CoA dehydrogenase family protein [Actinocrispum wychmicini]TCO59907.1 alkylation response protein AidB-like acyl-CoA dehydrogenase [Actinocrispum wychmicini]